MATETGTASDYRDLLQKLKLFLTGESVSPVGSNGLSWVVEEERSQYTSPQTDIPDGDADSLIQTAANNNQSHDQIIFRGNGGTSPEQEIYFAIQTLGLSTTGYYNWQIRGLTGFATSSPEYVPLVDQPGRSPPCYLLLQNTTMTYWFIANNRRIMGCIKTATVYHTFHIGFLNPYATIAEYPYPMMVAASCDEENVIFSNTAVRVSGIMHPGSHDATQTLPVQGDPFPTNVSSGYVRFNDGLWYAYKNFSGTGGTESRLTGSGNATGNVHSFPFSQVAKTNFPETKRLSDVDWVATDWMSTIAGANAAKQWLPALGSPQETVLWPITIFNPGNGQIMGDIDGLYWAPAAGGVTSEDTFTDSGESPEVTHIIFQSAWRTDAWMFMAMRYE
jgi:hypothetical protein